MKNNIDIKNLKAAKKYALALTKSATDCIDEINKDLENINEVIFQNQDFKTFFLHPIISLNDKKNIIKETLLGKINPKTLNFLEVLLDEGRFNLFNTIFELFKKETNKIKNIQTVEIISAVDLDEEMKKRLEEKLKEKLNKEIIMNFEKDKNILGGLIIKVEDNVVDLSLKAKFNSLKKELLY